MKRFWLLWFFLVLATGLAAQDPIKWQYAATKKENGLYEIRLLASLQKGWHIYSIHTPEGGPAPTKITFLKNPLVALEGAIKEKGKKEQQFEAVFDVNTVYYADQVAFVQAVRLKRKAKTRMAGTVEYMICNDRQCLPPTTQKFEMAFD